MAAHSGLAETCMLPTDINALRNGKILAEPKLQALRKFTQHMIEARGWVDDQEIEEFLNAGYTKQHLLEVILGIALKVIHNYTNHIARTPLDREFQPYAWEKPMATA
jgi:alkylhydroperoxidase family enzyme